MNFDCSIRGKLGSFPQLARNIGVLFAYIVGAYVDYKYVPCICIFLPFLFAIFFMSLPNTPQYHIKNGQIQVNLIQLFC